MMQMIRTQDDQMQVKWQSSMNNTPQGLTDRKSYNLRFTIRHDSSTKETIISPYDHTFEESLPSWDQLQR